MDPGVGDGISPAREGTAWGHELWVPTMVGAAPAQSSPSWGQGLSVLRDARHEMRLAGPLQAQPVLSELLITHPTAAEKGLGLMGQPRLSSELQQTPGSSLPGL